MTAVRDAAEMGFINPILVGDEKKIAAVGEEIGFEEL